MRILGPVDVTVGGVPRVVRGLRRKAVLAVLALRSAEIVSVDRLTEVVWGDEAPRTAANTLQSHVSYLRGVLGHRTAIAARPPGYVLDIGADATDLWVAQRLIDEATGSRDPNVRAAHLRAALANWRDRPLVDVRGLAWLDEQAERLHKIQLEAVDALTEARLALGEHAQLVPELDRRSHQDPFHEHLHGQLMLALYRSGRQADALATYQRMRHTLRDELGIDPSPALRDLEAAMLRQDPTLDPPRTAITVTPPHAGAAMAPGVLEREHEIAELDAAAREAVAGMGSVVLVSGEAGIGKSVLVDAVRGLLPPRSRLLVGCCDDLATPRTLGPFRDLAASIGTRLAAALRDAGDRDEVLDALRAELSTPSTVLAIEDVHWADEATLDALSFLAKRVAELPAVLVLTYRGDGLGSSHPLQRLLGQVATAPRVRRLELARLSETAVSRLVAPHRLDPREVFSVTGGNPFFVTEIIASGQVDQVPATVADAVLARLHRLDPDAHAALAQLAVIPSTVERWLVDALLPGGGTAVAAAEQGGLLTVSPTGAGFRHELIRRTVVDALPVARRVELNRLVLAALVERDGADLSRVVHHAAEAGDIDAIIHYGPQAAHAASRASSHREEAAHLRLVLQHKELLDADERARLLSRYAIACSTIADISSALIAQREAVELRRALGEPRALGADLLWLSRICWMAGESEPAQQGAEEAVANLEGTDDDQLLALALSHLSSLHGINYRGHDGVRLGERAVALARVVGDTTILSHALTSLGNSQARLDLPQALTTLDEGLQVALAAGAVADVCRATCGIADLLAEDLRHDEAMGYVTAAIELAEGAEQLRFLYHMQAYRAGVATAAGAWDQAMSAVELILDAQPPAQPPTRCMALTALGRMQVRRGLPGGEKALAEAWELARQTRELQNIGPVALARAEAAWLRDDHASIGPMLEPVYADACRLDARELLPELGYWLGIAGCPVPPVDSGHPFALWAGGRWREAAEIWRDAGCTYEYAATLAESTNTEDLANALTILDALGAKPLASRIRTQLREPMPSVVAGD